MNDEKCPADYTSKIFHICLYQNHHVIGHVEYHRRGKPAGVLKKQRASYSQQADGQPGHWRVVDCEQSRARRHRAPAAPLAVERAKKQAAKEVFLREWRERYGD
jgi:hypothetical protein